MTTTDSQTPASSLEVIASTTEIASEPGQSVQESLDGLSELLSSAEMTNETSSVESESHALAITPSGDELALPSAEADEANDLPNLALAPDEVATLQSLVLRYDQVIVELDRLNHQIESLLQSEGIKACES